MLQIGTCKAFLLYFELKFCGVVPMRRGNSAALILERAHNTLNRSDIAIKVPLALISGFFDHTKAVRYFH